jgi:hypothetical protein
MFVKRVDDEEGRRLERKQQIIIILSFPAHREVSRGIVNWCFGASTIRSKHRIPDAPYGYPSLGGTGLLIVTSESSRSDQNQCVTKGRAVG